MWVIASAVVLCSIAMAKFAIPFVTVEYVTYSDAKVKAQVVANMPVVSANVRLEYRIATLRVRGFPTASKPSSILCVEMVHVVTSASSRDPLGLSKNENRAISTDWLVAGFIAKAVTWKV